MSIKNLNNLAYNSLIKTTLFKLLYLSKESLSLCFDRSFMFSKLLKILKLDVADIKKKQTLCFVLLD